MHYKNGRKAEAGDVVVLLNGNFSKTGVLFALQPGSDTCNARLASIVSPELIKIKDCVHIDDVIVGFPDLSKAQSQGGNKLALDNPTTL